jgi:signal transduction histidine kinase
MSDASALSIVFANLLENAAEYSNEGGIVRVTARNADHAVEAEVANTGCTLTEEQVARLFDRFWRADASRKDTSLHAGLGLALVRRIADLLGAAVTAGASDQEFTVRIRLPVISVIS